MMTVVAMQMLDDAGFKVTSAERVPGLWNVDGLARDVTTNQLLQLASQYGFTRLGPPIELRFCP